MARHGKKIHYTHWTGFEATFLALGAGSSAATVGAALHEPETLLRTRGSLVCYVDAVQAPSAMAQVAIGIIPVPEGTGTTVLWSPITDSDAPWLYYSRFVVGWEEGVTDVIEVAGLGIYRETVDSKAQRILRNQETQCVIEQTTLNGAVSVNATLTGRFLSGTG